MKKKILLIPLILVGPALVVLFTPFVGPQVVFLISTALVLMLALASGLALRPSHVAHYRAEAAVER